MFCCVCKSQGSSGEDFMVNKKDRSPDTKGFFGASSYRLLKNTIVIIRSSNQMYTDEEK